MSWRQLLRLGREEQAARETFFMGGLWWMFLLGALGGTVAYRRFGLPSLAVPVALLLAVIVYDGVHPINPRGQD